MRWIYSSRPACGLSSFCVQHFWCQVIHHDADPQLCQSSAWLFKGQRWQRLKFENNVTLGCSALAPQSPPNYTEQQWTSLDLGMAKQQHSDARTQQQPLEIELSCLANAQTLLWHCSGWVRATAVTPISITMGLLSCISATQLHGSIWAGVQGKHPSLLPCWRFVQPRRALCAQGAALLSACSPSSWRWACVRACDPCLCAFLCVVYALLSVPDFIKMRALLFKVDKHVSKCMFY